MREVLLKSIETLPNDQLDALFAQVFSLDPLPYTAKDHTLFLQNLVLDHAIRLEADRTVTRGCEEIQIQLIPRANRLNFESLRTIYFQGLAIDAHEDFPQFTLRSVTRRGIDYNATLMRCLLELAFKDAFQEGW